MKKLLFIMLALWCAMSLSAQEIVVGDMNDDQELTVGDVADLVSTINGQKAVRRISLLQADNSAIVGSWQSAQGGITFNEDGTTDYDGAQRYKFYPSQGRIVLFGTGSQVVAVLDLIDMEEGTMVLSPRGTTIYTTYYKGSAVSGLTISQNTIQGALGQTYQLTVSITPPDAAITAITWESSNTNVATVDQTGLVNIVGGGTATITASATDGSGKHATCTITVPKYVTSITLSETSLVLDLDETRTLTATIAPADADNPALTWESSNPDVVVVNKSGKIIAMDYGTATITCSATDGSGVMATCEVSVPQTINGHEYVDLGLPSGIMWATCNVGADNPEDYGDYYAWGETETKSTYDWSTYKWCNGWYDTLTKYCTKSSYGTVDNKTTLDPEDDVAHVKWGGDWRMPTKAEQDELSDTNNCTWTWTTQGGMNGYLVTSKKNGNFIFLPAAGYRNDGSPSYAGSRGCYWSSSLYTNSSNTAYDHDFNSGNVGWSNCGRCVGQCVRPVCPSSSSFVSVTSITLNKESMEMTKGETYQLSATISPANATNQNVTWSSGNSNVATVSNTGLVTAMDVGSATITCAATDGSGKISTCTVTVKSNGSNVNVNNGHEYVDLGLPSGLMWATCNVGADNPEDYGDYYAWGETETKSTYGPSTYFDSDDAKYNTSKKTTLDPEDDVAHVKWGGDWRMPTKAEQDELCNSSNCTWTWTTQGGKNGYLVTSKKNGNSIFLPASGYRYDSSLYDAGSWGFYWSSSLRTSDSNYAYGLYFDSGDVDSSNYNRLFGFTVRPVCPSSSSFVSVTSITLNKGSMEMTKDETYQLSATINPTNATNKNITWSSSNTNVATVSNTGLVTAMDVGSATITCSATDGSGVIGTCEVKVAKPTDYNGHEYVDLGLPSGLKWATCNVGASSPEEFGDYFQWASTVPVDMTRTGSDQSPVNASDYKVSLVLKNAPYQTANTTSPSSTKWTKYVGSTTSSYKDVSATNDNALKTVLDPEDDAAYVNWGGSWRMPTMTEQEELRTECTWIWTTSYNGTGVKGYIVTGKKEGYTDKSIFLPAAGCRNGTGLDDAGSYGLYWSSSLNASSPAGAYFLSFNSSGVYRGSSFRFYGRCVRPICQ